MQGIITKAIRLAVLLSWFQMMYSLAQAAELKEPLDWIPEDLSHWEDHGPVLSAEKAIRWEEQSAIGVVGVEKVEGVYYLFYS